MTAHLSPAGALSVLSVHPDDPLAAPLSAELAAEYDRRYGDLFGGAAEELTRYPVAEFLPPDGDLVLLVADGQPVAGGAFRRHEGPGTAEVKRMWTSAAHRRRGLARRVLAELETRAPYLAAGWTPLFDPAVLRPTDIEALRRLPVAERLYAFEKLLGVPA